MKSLILIIFIFISFGVVKTATGACPADEADFANGGTFSGNCSLNSVIIPAGKTVIWEDGKLSITGSLVVRGTFILKGPGVVETTNRLGAQNNGSITINGIAQVGTDFLLLGTSSLCGTGYLKYGGNLNIAVGATTKDVFTDCNPADVDCGDPTLPVDLLHFTSENYDDQVTLYWSTASETNNKGFQVEQSYDAEFWNSIGFVEGNGTINTLSQYQFEVGDLQVDSYFRLKQIDFDGHFEYSHIIFHESDALSERISFYPNSVSNTATLAGPSDYEFAFQLTDFNGKILIEYDQTYLSDAEFAVNELLPFMRSGLYLINVKTPHDQYALKMIKN